MDGMAIPLGCRFTFEPNDLELLIYLECKSMGVALPGEGFVKEVDLYGLSDPGVLFRGTDEKSVYVFTKLKKVVKNGKRVERTVSGNRCWKGVDAGKPIYDAKGFLVGEKKNFVLINKMKMKFGYNMIEFSLDKEILKNSRYKDYVVCKIKKKAKKKSPSGNFSEEDISSAPVSWSPVEEDSIPISEERYQHEGKIQEEEEAAQLCHQVSESHQQLSNFTPMLCWDFGSDLISSEIFDPNTFKEVMSWTKEDALAVLESLDTINGLASAPAPVPLLDPLADDYSAVLSIPSVN